MRAIQRTALVFAVALLATFAQRSRANLILNGSFETPIVTDGDYSRFWFVPDTHAVQVPTSWTAGGSGFGYLGRTNGAGAFNTPAADGQQRIQLDQGLIFSQSFASVIGETYTMTFDYQRNPATGLALFGARFDGASTFVENNFTTNSDAWTPGQIQFIADSTTTTVSFRANDVLVSPPAGSYSQYVRIDDVVVFIPEPMSGSLMAIVGGACLARRRSRRVNAV
jgi:hypothetical protein